MGCGAPQLLAAFTPPSQNPVPKSLSLVRGHLKAGGCVVVAILGGVGGRRRSSQISHIQKLWAAAGEGRHMGLPPYGKGGETCRCY